MQDNKIWERFVLETMDIDIDDNLWKFTVPDLIRQKITVQERAEARLACLEQGVIKPVVKESYMTNDFLAKLYEDIEQGKINFMGIKKK